MEKELKKKLQTEIDAILCTHGVTRVCEIEKVRDHTRAETFREIIYFIESTSKEEGNNNQGNSEEISKFIIRDVNDYHDSMGQITFQDIIKTIKGHLQQYSSSHNVISDTDKLQIFISEELREARLQFRLAKTDENQESQKYYSGLLHGLARINYFKSKLQSKELPLPEAGKKGCKTCDGSGYTNQFHPDKLKCEECNIESKEELKEGSDLEKMDMLHKEAVGISNQLRNEILPELTRRYKEDNLIEWRVSMQSESYFILHPMDNNGATFDIKWMVDSQTHKQESDTKEENK